MCGEIRLWTRQHLCGSITERAFWHDRLYISPSPLRRPRRQSRIITLTIPGEKYYCGGKLPIFFFVILFIYFFCLHHLRNCLYFPLASPCLSIHLRGGLSVFFGQRCCDTNLVNSCLAASLERCESSCIKNVFWAWIQLDNDWKISKCKITDAKDQSHLLPSHEGQRLKSIPPK